MAHIHPRARRTWPPVLPLAGWIEELIGAGFEAVQAKQDGNTPQTSHWGLCCLPGQGKGSAERFVLSLESMGPEELISLSTPYQTRTAYSAWGEYVWSYVRIESEERHNQHSQQVGYSMLMDIESRMWRMARMTYEAQDKRGADAFAGGVLRREQKI